MAHESGAAAAAAHATGEVPTRRDFLFLATGALGAIGIASVAWPFIDQMNPAADTLALKEIEVDLSAMEVGQAITVKWQGKPVFIRYRTPEEIEEARSVDVADLPDPATDESRVLEAPWLIVIGICTHLGCIPQGQLPGSARGEYGGWLCSCHGSQYDTSGRIRSGPAPQNLHVPPYTFLNETRVLIGKASGTTGGENGNA